MQNLVFLSLWGYAVLTIMQVIVYDYVHIAPGALPEEMFPVHARRDYYGCPRFDFVQVRNDEAGDEPPWIACVMAFLRVWVPEHHLVEEAGYVNVALVQWMERVADAVDGMPTYEFMQAVDAIYTESIMHHINLLLQPDDRPNPVPRMAAMPWGKSAALIGAL